MTDDPAEHDTLRERVASEPVLAVETPDHLSVTHTPPPLLVSCVSRFLILLYICLVIY